MREPTGPPWFAWCFDHGRLHVFVPRGEHECPDGAWCTARWVRLAGTTEQEATADKEKRFGEAVFCHHLPPDEHLALITTGGIDVAEPTFPTRKDLARAIDREGLTALVEDGWTPDDMPEEDTELYAAWADLLAEVEGVRQARDRVKALVQDEGERHG